MSKFDNSLIVTRNRLVNEITLFRYDEFNKNPGLNKWSAAQICLHLVLVEKAFTKAIIYGLKKVDSIKIDRKNLNFMSDRTKKIDSPEIVKPNSEPIDVQQAIDLLNNSRKEFLAVLSTVKDNSIFAEKSAKHPIFGELPLDQWIELLYLHELRHIEQIKEIKFHIGVGD